MTIKAPKNVKMSELFPDSWLLQENDRCLCIVFLIGIQIGQATYWPLEASGCCMRVVTKAGFTEICPCRAVVMRLDDRQMVGIQGFVSQPFFIGFS